MTYTQLTREQRYQISALLKEQHPQQQIAANLGVHPSTISREVRRNRGQRGYRPKQADELAEARKQQRVKARIQPETWAQVAALVRQEWSPEQIAGRLALEKQLSVSHERIYQYLYADKARGGDLYRHPRCQKQRRKRYGSYDRRGQLTDRRSIEERPTVVDAKERLGDWEGDTIIGRNHQQAIVSLVARQSQFVRLAPVERNTAAAVAAAMQAQLHSLTVKTITTDNGREFAQHQEIARSLGAAFYFAHPYSSWERGLNEQVNGLVRQYFPKRHDFATITADEITHVVERLNHRPRKTLGYKTPHEVYFKRPLIALTT